MASKRKTLRDWHRLFGLLLTDLFSGSPFVVEVEADLSVQKQLLDVVIVRRGRGRFSGRLPDGLEGLRPHNLITFKSHREALDTWAMKELAGHYVAYRKLVSRSPSELLPEDRFGLYAVCARFPQQLSGLVPWQPVKPGVYDCLWATDTIRVVVAGELPREPRNAPLHLFSASPDLVGFGGRAYQRHSENTSGLLVELLQGLQAEGFPMPYTMEDFRRDFVKEHFSELTPEEREDVIKEHFPKLTRKERADVIKSLSPEERADVIKSLPPVERADVIKSLPLEERMAGLTEEQVRQFLDRSSAAEPAAARPPRRKK
jgi:hypothetical protein